MSFPVKAVIFDWAGTVIDFGCMAPVEALIAVFAQAGLALSEAEARADMGKAKLDHLRALLAEPGIAGRWQAAKGAAPAEADVTALYARLEPAMAEAAARHDRLIPGAAETVADLRALGVKIGSGSGYTRAMMDAIAPAAAAQGYAPQVIICAGETPSGRPAPLMCWAALIALDAWPAGCCIKIDDAPVGIAEGRNAGCWAIGVSASGNEVGMSREGLLALPPEEARARITAAEVVLREAGAHYVIDDISQLLPVIQAIAARIAAGESPG